MLRRGVMAALFLAVVALGVSATAAAAEKVKLSLWTGQPDKWKDVIEAFQAKHPNIEVVPEKVDLKGPDLNQFMLMRIQTRRVADIVDLEIPVDLIKNYVLPLDEYMKRDGVFDWPWTDPSILKSVRFPDGHWYFIPGGFVVYGLWYNTDLAKKLGVYDRIPKSYDDPKMQTWDWDTYVKLLKDATVDTDGDGQIDIYGTDDSLNWGLASWWAAVHRGEWAGDLEKARAIGRPLDDPNVIKATQFVVDLALVHKVAPPPTLDAQAAGIKIETERVLMRMMGTWAYTYFAYNVNPNRAKEGKPPINFAFAPYPRMPGDTKPAGVQGWFHWLPVIMRLTAHPNEAWEFVKFSRSPEFLREHYDLVRSGGTIPPYRDPQIVRRFAEQVGQQQAELLLDMLQYVPDEWKVLRGPWAFVPREAEKYRTIKLAPGQSPGELWAKAQRQIERGEVKAADVMPEIARKWQEVALDGWRAWEKLLAEKGQ